MLNIVGYASTSDMLNTIKYDENIDFACIDDFAVLVILLLGMQLWITFFGWDVDTVLKH